MEQNSVSDVPGQRLLDLLLASARLTRTSCGYKIDRRPLQVRVWLLVLSVCFHPRQKVPHSEAANPQPGAHPASGRLPAGRVYD